MVGSEYPTRQWGSIPHPTINILNEVNAKMVLKMNTSIDFCGEKRKFTRCANKTLKDYQKTIEDIQDELTPLAECTRDFQFKLTELNDEIGSIDKHIELLEKLEDASDEEIRECIALTKERNSLQREIHKVRKLNDDAEKEDRQFYEDLEEKLREAYGEFASKIFDNFKADEIEEADQTDLTIAPRLGELYRLSTTGAKQKEIDKLYAKIVKDSFR